MLYLNPMSSINRIQFAAPYCCLRSSALRASLNACSTSLAVSGCDSDSNCLARLAFRS